MSEKDKVFVLRVIKYGESDLVLHTLAKSGERLNFLARGALKSKKRFGGGVLEATHFLQIQYHRSRHEGGLHTLEEATLLDGFSGLRSDYDRLSMALYFLRLIDLVTLEGSVGDQSLFNLLGHALRTLLKATNLAALKTHFEAKLLYQQGVLPTHIEGFGNLLKTPLASHGEGEVSLPEAPVRVQLKSILSQHFGGREDLLK